MFIFGLQTTENLFRQLLFLNDLSCTSECSKFLNLPGILFHRVVVKSAGRMKKKLDNRIRVLIENSVAIGHRSFFVVVGDKGRDQVVILHHMLSKAQVKARPSVLWCYKKDLGFCRFVEFLIYVLKGKICP